MKSLKEFINEAMNTSNEETTKENETVDESQEEYVYAVEDVNGTILNVFPTEQEANEDLQNWNSDAEAKVKKMKKSEIEEK